jgi:hypothetical protein
LAVAFVTEDRRFKGTLSGFKIDFNSEPILSQQVSPELAKFSKLISEPTSKNKKAAWSM